MSVHSGSLEKITLGGAWLAQPMELATLDRGVVDSSPTLGVEVILKNKIY